VLATAKVEAASPPTPQQQRVLIALRARVAMSNDLAADTAYFRGQVLDKHRRSGSRARL